MSDLKNKIEALLFASGKGLPVEEIADYCEEKLALTKKKLTLLHTEFQERDGSLVVEEHNNKWKMTVRGKYTDYIKKIVSETELPGPILKTLAIIAYKSPVLQADVVHMRGQGAYDHIKQLAKQKFLTKDEEGRSYILRITDKFFNYFDVEGDQEIRDIFATLKKNEEKRRVEVEEQAVLAQQQKLGELKVVESQKEGDHEKIFDNTYMGGITKQRTEEELKEEKQFLTNMDSKIDEISSRLDKHILPKREEEIENEKSIQIDSDNEENKEQIVSEEEKKDEEKEENYL